MAIVSRRPQTTRTRITGIRHLPHAQIVFVDTPGLHAGVRAARRADAAGGGTRAGGRGPGLLRRRGHRAARPRSTWRCLNRLAAVRAPVYLLPEQGGPGRAQVSAAAPHRRVSRAAPVRRDRADLRGARAPDATRSSTCSLRGPARTAARTFPRESLTDQPETFFVAEAIREKIFRLTHQEIPYACAVRVEELIGARAARVPVHPGHRSSSSRSRRRASSSAAGRRCSSGSAAAAREDLERFFGIKTYLDLRVPVRKNWRKDDRALREFGFLLTS